MYWDILMINYRKAGSKQYYIYIISLICDSDTWCFCCVNRMPIILAYVLRAGNETRIVRERHKKGEYEWRDCGIQIIGLLYVRCGLTWCHTSTHPLNPWRTVRKIWIRNLERSMADKRSAAGLCRFSRDKCRARGSDAWVLDTLWRARWRSAGSGVAS